MKIDSGIYGGDSRRPPCMMSGQWAGYEARPYENANIVIYPDIRKRQGQKIVGARRRYAGKETSKSYRSHSYFFFITVR